MIKLMKFKDNLKTQIELKNLKLGEISKATGIPKSTLSEWTAGREPKVSENLLKLAQFLEVSLEYLFTGKDTLLIINKQEKANVHFKMDGEDYLLKLIKLNKN